MPGDGLPNCRDRLLRRIRDRRPAERKETLQVLQRRLIVRICFIDMLDQPRLMKLHPLRENRLRQRHAHRATEVARHVDERRCLIGLIRPDAVVRR